MAGLCEGGNEPQGSLKANWYHNDKDCIYDNDNDDVYYIEKVMLTTVSIVVTSYNGNDGDYHNHDNNNDCYDDNNNDYDFDDDYNSDNDDYCDNDDDEYFNDCYDCDYNQSAN
ncbi:hypothetical protein ANN_16567 [Periplaneta americana]|uniref:Uncharacterized protein n=1 Tax=Periplaneta americana TaxID=6978 RepID=A0ABQ8SS12_PERAM|nr:hypothetical protein ANN_16567 [Periplaneta americana]